MSQNLLMMRKYFAPLLLLFVASFWAACSNDAPSSKPVQPEPAPATAAPSPEPTEAAIQADTVEAAAPEKPVGEKVENGVNTGEKIAKPKKQPIASRTPIANAAGNPTGYISRKNVVLQEKPAADAPKVGSMKIYETVVILETKMTDDAGKAFDVPQWYKVQLSNKQIGWVVSRSVTVN